MFNSISKKIYLKRLDSADIAVRQRAAVRLAELNEPLVVPYLIQEYLKDKPQFAYESWAANALNRFDKTLIQHFIAWLKENYGNYGISSAFTLAENIFFFGRPIHPDIYKWMTSDIDQKDTLRLVKQHFPNDLSTLIKTIVELGNIRDLDGLSGMINMVPEFIYSSKSITDKQKMVSWLENIALHEDRVVRMNAVKTMIELKKSYGRFDDIDISFNKIDPTRLSQKLINEMLDFLANDPNGSLELPIRVLDMKPPPTDSLLRVFIKFGDKKTNTKIIDYLSTVELNNTNYIRLINCVVEFGDDAIYALRRNKSSSKKLLAYLESCATGEINSKLSIIEDTDLIDNLYFVPSWLLAFFMRERDLIRDKVLNSARLCFDLAGPGTEKYKDPYSSAISVYFAVSINNEAQVETGLIEHLIYTNQFAPVFQVALYQPEIEPYLQNEFEDPAKSASIIRAITELDAQFFELLLEWSRLYPKIAVNLLYARSFSDKKDLKIPEWLVSLVVESNALESLDARRLCIMLLNKSDESYRYHLNSLLPQVLGDHNGNRVVQHKVIEKLIEDDHQLRFFLGSASVIDEYPNVGEKVNELCCSRPTVLKDFFTFVSPSIRAGHNVSQPFAAVLEHLSTEEKSTLIRKVALECHRYSICREILTLYAEKIAMSISALHLWFFDFWKAWSSDSSNDVLLEALTNIPLDKIEALERWMVLKGMDFVVMRLILDSENRSFDRHLAVRATENFDRYNEAILEEIDGRSDEVVTHLASSVFNSSKNVNFKTRAAQYIWQTDLEGLLTRSYQKAALWSGNASVIQSPTAEIESDISEAISLGLASDDFYTLLARVGTIEHAEGIAARFADYLYEVEPEAHLLFKLGFKSACEQAIQHINAYLDKEEKLWNSTPNLDMHPQDRDYDDSYLSREAERTVSRRIFDNEKKLIRIIETGKG